MSNYIRAVNEFNPNIESYPTPQTMTYPTPKQTADMIRDYKIPQLADAGSMKLYFPIGTVRVYLTEETEKIYLDFNDTCKETIANSQFCCGIREIGTLDNISRFRSDSWTPELRKIINALTGRFYGYSVNSVQIVNWGKSGPDVVRAMIAGLTRNIRDALVDKGIFWLSINYQETLDFPGVVEALKKNGWKSMGWHLHKGTGNHINMFTFSNPMTERFKNALKEGVVYKKPYSGPP